jgi:hypothetical protein
MATPPETPVADATGTFSGAVVKSCTCIRCRTVYPPHLVEWAFRVNQLGRKRLCCMCERVSRQNQRNPYLVKAHSVIRRHADGLKIRREDLVTIYGWDPQILAQDAEHQYAGRCNYCRDPYIGLADITLDIQDRQRKPYYCTNTKWCCQGCNRDKGVMTPEEFEARRQIRALWKQSKNDPPEQLMLFEAG